MSNAEIREANWPKIKSLLEQQMMLCTSKLEQVQVRSKAAKGRRLPEGACCRCVNAGCCKLGARTCVVLQQPACRCGARQYCRALLHRPVIPCQLPPAQDQSTVIKAWSSLEQPSPTS